MGDPWTCKLSCSSWLTLHPMLSKYGLVQKEHQVLMIFKFLIARAWTFYLREVLWASEEWSLKHFFKELFNDCFPINYQNKQRSELQHLQQSKMSVWDYVGELQELFTIVGYTNKKEKIVKLFNGFQPSIQQELYWAGFNPEISKWKKVVAKAKFIKMAESIDLEFGEGSNSGTPCQEQSEKCSGHFKCGERRHCSGQSRSKSPFCNGYKTNTQPAYSAKKGMSKASDVSRA